MEQLEERPSDALGALDAVVQGAELTDLARLYDPRVMLAMAPIAPNPNALRHGRALANSGLCSSVVEVSTPDGVPAAGVLDRLATGEGDHGEAWGSYLEQVTSCFALLFGAEVVGVRQVVSDGPHCPRFHVDRVHARGIINVVGPCTEWLSDDNVDRSRLGHAGGPDDAQSGLVGDWSRLARIDSGALAIFKGTAWPGAADRAIVHRSPPANGSRRLLLTLDWLQ